MVPLFSASKGKTLFEACAVMVSDSKKRKPASGCAGCRTFSEPVRAVVLKLLPFLPAAKEREAHFARLYGIWDGWIQHMLARGPPSEADDSMWACITRVRNPSTGLFCAQLCIQDSACSMLQAMVTKRIIVLARLHC